MISDGLIQILCPYIAFVVTMSVLQLPSSRREGERDLSGRDLALADHLVLLAL